MRGPPVCVGYATPVSPVACDGWSSGKRFVFRSQATGLTAAMILVKLVAWCQGFRTTHLLFHTCSSDRERLFTTALIRVGHTSPGQRPGWAPRHGPAPCKGATYLAETTLMSRPCRATIVRCSSTRGFTPGWYVPTLRAGRAGQPRGIGTWWLGGTDGGLPADDAAGGGVGLVGAGEGDGAADQAGN